MFTSPRKSTSWHTALRLRKKSEKKDKDGKREGKLENGYRKSREGLGNKVSVKVSTGVSRSRCQNPSSLGPWVAAGAGAGPRASWRAAHSRPVARACLAALCHPPRHLPLAADPAGLCRGLSGTMLTGTGTRMYSKEPATHGHLTRCTPGFYKECCSVPRRSRG